ncbi:hypothetical protein ACP4OV_024213 [Aristida adscensionis]
MHLSASAQPSRTWQRMVAGRMTTLALLISWLASLLAGSSPSTSAPADGFDHIVLALQWPGTVCRSSAAAGRCCPSNACCPPTPSDGSRSVSFLVSLIDGPFSSTRFVHPRFNDDFINPVCPSTRFVHPRFHQPGLSINPVWPSYAKGYGPTCCNHQDFDMAKISNLTTELDKYWPSLYCSSPSLCSGGHGSLWAHEWEKHGTCAYPVIQDEYSYFSTALQMYSTYIVTAMLESKISIGADDGGGKYPVTQLVATIKGSFGASPLLICDGESLQELRLCFSKDLKHWQLNAPSDPQMPATAAALREGS